MRKSTAALTIAVTALTATAHAQQKADTTLKSTTIEVIQSYKPEVKQAPKPVLVAELPPRDTARPTLKYDVPQQTLYYTYSALPLRPLALGKDTTELPFQNYIKLGGGNLSTIYFDAGIGSLKGSNYETALHLHHLSQNGNIKNQKVALSGIEADGTLHAKSYDWHFSLSGLRNQYYFYGYDHDSYNYKSDTVQQVFTGIEATVDFKNTRSNRWNIDFHPAVSGYIYGDHYSTTERSIAFDIPLTKDIDSSLKASLGLRGALTTLSASKTDWGNNIFQLTPRLSFHKGNFTGRIGLYPTAGSYYSLMLLPDIEASYRFPNSMVSITGGWLASIRQNTYRQLTGFNPYLSPLSQYPPFYETRQTKTDEVFGMIRSSIGNHLSATARVSWWQYNNLPMFLNDIADRKNFYIQYDDQVNALALQLSLRYQVTTSFGVGLNGSFYNYYNKTDDRVWHEPGLRLKADMIYQPLPALTITAYATILDQIYALNEKHQEVKLDGVFDIGAGAEYSFIPRLSAFLNVNNLLNDRYQRWYSYEVYGINVYGGLRLKF
jgi:hypothetical protein